MSLQPSKKKQPFVQPLFTGGVVRKDVTLGWHFVLSTSQKTVPVTSFSPVISYMARHVHYGVFSWDRIIVPWGSTRFCCEGCRPRICNAMETHSTGIISPEDSCHIGKTPSRPCTFRKFSGSLKEGANTSLNKDFPSHVDTCDSQPVSISGRIDWRLYTSDAPARDAWAGRWH